MKKGLLLVLFSLLLTACENFGTPKDVIQTAWTAAQKSDLEVFRKTMTGTALASFGTVEGMAEFRKFSSVDQVTLDEPVLLKSEESVCHRPLKKHCVQRLRDYQVLAARQMVRFDVQCKRTTWWTQKNAFEARTECSITDIVQ